MAPTTALFMTFQGGGAGRDLHWVHRPTQPEPAMNKEKSQAFMLKVVSDLATSLAVALVQDRKSTRLNSSHLRLSRMPSSA